MTKPLLIYDGDCSFCRIWIEYWKEITNGTVEFEPYQTAASRFPIPRENLAAAVHLVTSDGTFQAAAAVFRTLQYVPGKEWIYRLYHKLPVFASAAEFSYRFIARHRNLFYRITRILWGKSVRPVSFVYTRKLFLRLLGVVYFVAFVSLASQI